MPGISFSLPGKADKILAGQCNFTIRAVRKKADSTRGQVDPL